MLESTNQKWLEFIQQSTATKRREEEEKCDKIANGKRRVLQLINEGKEIIISLTSYCDDFETTINHAAS